VVSHLTMFAKCDERTAKACSVKPRTVQRIVSVWTAEGVGGEGVTSCVSVAR